MLEKYFHYTAILQETSLVYRREAGWHHSPAVHSGGIHRLESVLSCDGGLLQGMDHLNSCWIGRRVDVRCFSQKLCSEPQLPQVTIEKNPACQPLIVHNRERLNEHDLRPKTSTWPGCHFGVFAGCSADNPIGWDKKLLGSLGDEDPVWWREVVSLWRVVWAGRFQRVDIARQWALAPRWAAGRWGAGQDRVH